MKRVIALILSLVLSALCSFGCQYADTHKEHTISITDATGSTVDLPVNPQRVAVLFSSFADIWVTAGGTVDITVQESVDRGFADSNAVLVDSGAGKTINVEQLIAAKPDLVILSADIDAQNKASKLCMDAGIASAAFRVESFADYLAVLEIFTTLTQRPDLFEKHGSQVKQKIDATLHSLPKDAEETSVLFIRAGSGSRSTKAKGTKDHFACGMLKDLGTRNIADSAPILLDGLSFEEILIQDPDHIFITTMGDTDAAINYMQSLLKQPQWQSLQAVKNGNIHILPKDLFQYKPNAKWAEAYQYLINIIQK